VGTTVWQSTTRLARLSAILLSLAFGPANLVLDSQAPRPTPKPEPQPALGFIRNTDDFDGAGCSLWRLGDRTYTDGRYILLADFGERAVVNLGGRDTPLKLVGSSGANREHKKGDRLMYHYRGEGVNVVIKYIVTGVCAPDEESCEVTNYDAEITIATRSGKRTLRAHGICGS
jgi:hypothetical protein